MMPAHLASKAGVRAAALASLGAAALLLVACERSRPTEGVLLGEFREVADFTFTAENGEPFALDDLRGKVWVANFIFTSCAAECLVLSARVAELQRHLRDYDDVAFVSISVDPQTDTPERLKAFAERWHADPERWRFLTGDVAEIDELVLKSFLLPITRDPIELGKLFSQNLIHSNRFAIVDRNGVVRAYVEGLPNESVSSILRIVVQLREEPALLRAEASVD